MVGRSAQRDAAKQRPEHLILGRRMRRDGFGFMLFGASGLGAVLNGVVFPRLGGTGGILQQVSTGILFGRAIVFTASGAPRRQRLLPRSLTVVELIVDGVATIAGFWAWIVQPFLARYIKRPGRAVPSLWARHTVPKGTARAVTVSRIAAAATFVLHTLRLAIYLSPSRGLLEGAASEAPIRERSIRK